MEKAAFLCTDGEGTKETREAMRDFILFVVLPIVLLDCLVEFIKFMFLWAKRKREVEEDES